MAQALLSLALTCCLLLSSTLHAQVSFTDFPDDYQLVPRLGDARSATYRVRGGVSAPALGKRLSAKLFQGATLVDSSSQALAYNNGTAAFDLAIEIPVTRANHTLEVSLDGTVVGTADYLVAGDVYVVNGQSNALALLTPAVADRDSFLRGASYGTGAWALMQLSNSGVWMGRAARILSQTRDVPVAAFNFAVGGMPIEFFRKGRTPRGNFEAALDTLRAYGVAGRVRALIWFQGEADVATYSAERYRRELSSLLDDYRADYGIPHFYGFQTRAISCGVERAGVMEGQRQLARERADFDLMSTLNATLSADECHFVSVGGYDVLGERMAALILYREGRAQSSPKVLAPAVDSARITGLREVTVWFDTHGAGLAATGNPYVEFRANGATVLTPTGGRVSGDRLLLTFGQDVSAATGLTYLSHGGPAPDYLQSAAGPGVITFDDLPFVRGDGDIGVYGDVRLALASKQASVRQSGELEAILTLYNEGSSTLRLIEVDIPTPRGLTFIGAQVVAGTIAFDATQVEWRLPRLAPGDSATLPIRYSVTEALSTITLYAQVAELGSRDPDSTPGNGTTGVVTEDDESRIVIGDRDKDCVFSVEVVAATCRVKDRDSVLVFSLGARDDRPSALRITAPGTPTIDWPHGTRQEVTVERYAAHATTLGRFPVTVTRASDATCATMVAVDPPDTCSGLSAVGAARGRASEVIIYPNPLRSGEALRLRLPPGVSSSAEFSVWTTTGRRMSIGEATREDDTTVVLRLTLPAGMYVAAVGELRQLFTVLE